MDGLLTPASCTTSLNYQCYSDPTKLTRLCFIGILYFLLLISVTYAVALGQLPLPAEFSLLSGVGEVTEKLDALACSFGQGHLQVLSAVITG